MGKELRVLVIEDSEDDTALLIRALAREGGYKTTHARVDSLKGLQRALEGREWDIVVSDHSMPNFSAVAALKELKDRGLDVPVIILSGTIEPGAAVSAMKAGASDYIRKEDTLRLLPAIERELREAESRREKRRAEERFHQVQKLESVGKLAGGVAHDFNNILTAILGYANFLAGGPQEASWRGDVEEIRKAAERGAALTRQLLSFSRRQALQPRLLDLNAEFSDLERMLRRLVGEDIRWTLSLDPTLGPVRADPGQIQQVLMNLVVNARDAMPGGGRLSVVTSNVELREPRAEGVLAIPAGSYVVVSVGDTGVGMEEAVKANIFEPFFTTKERGKGTGLGLAVIYGIVKQSGGHIAVDSVLGKGTTFTLYFPRAEGVPEAPGGTPAAPAPRRGHETLLLVDDDPAVRAMTRRALTEQGYAVLEAGRADEALRLARAHQESLALLVTDMVLPDVNGLELARELAVVCPAAKVLLISGYLDRDFGDYVVDEKTPFLQKPFTPAALAKTVRDVLDAGRPAR